MCQTLDDINTIKWARRVNAASPEKGLFSNVRT